MEMGGESGMFTVHQTARSVLCCKCGILMPPNVANMCVKCVCSQVDITEGLQKHVTIVHCPECDSYLQPPRTWLKAQLESIELLTFCINRLKNLNQVRLIHAEFIWTEPHSKRIKVKLKVQKQVLNGVVLEQAYMVEYVIHDQMCESCSRVHADPDQWVAVVQLRQHVSHRRTFYYLEQLILKHDAAVRAIKIKQMDRGIDFFFNNRSHAVKFAEFVSKVVPVKSHNDKQLGSHDTHSNNCNYKFSFSVEICPVCREDLVFLPPKISVSLGNFGPLVICTKIINSICLLDPLTLRHCNLNPEQYWRESFTSFLSSKQLVKYVVLDVNHVSYNAVNMAQVLVARVSDFGKNDTKFFVRTHLGNMLNAGDYAFGYDLQTANWNDTELDMYRGVVIPYVILVKKSSEEKRRGKRLWKLKSLNMEVDRNVTKGREDEETEYERFCRDIEENPEIRFNISLYRDNGDKPLEELFEGLGINDEDGQAEGMRE